MAEKPVTFTEKGAKRIARATRAFEREQPGGRDIERPAPYVPPSDQPTTSPQYPGMVFQAASNNQPVWQFLQSHQPI